MSCIKDKILIEGEFVLFESNSVLLESLPNELILVISSYLNEESLLEFEEFLSSEKDQIKIDYEKLYAMIYPRQYGKTKTIFRVDKNLRKYKNIWDILYFEEISYNKGYLGPAESSVITIGHSYLIYSIYPNCYYFKEKIIKLGLRSDYSTMWIIRILRYINKIEPLEPLNSKLKSLLKDGKLTFKYKELSQEIFKDQIDGETLIFLSIIFMDDKYFELDINNMLLRLEPIKLENIIFLQTGHISGAIPIEYIINYFKSYTH